MYLSSEPTMAVKDSDSDLGVQRFVTVLPCTVAILVCALMFRGEDSSTLRALGFHLLLLVAILCTLTAGLNSIWQLRKELHKRDIEHVIVGKLLSCIKSMLLVERATIATRVDVHGFDA